MGRFLVFFFLGLGCLASARAQYTYAPQSALREGNWFRIGVTEDGVYALYPSDLEQLGAGTDMPILSVRVFGYGGTMLPERNNRPNPDDLLENPVKAYDVNGDNLFNGNDYILFYGKGPGEWVHMPNANRFEYRRNIYIDTAMYFISVNNGAALSLPDMPSVSGSPDYTSDSWDDFAIIEKDSLNLTNTGRRWFWKDFKYEPSHTLTVNVPGGFRPDSLIYARVTVAARCINCLSSYSATVNGTPLGNFSIGAVPPASTFASDGERRYSFNSSASTFSFLLKRESPAGQNIDGAWLDFIEINGRRYASRVGSQMHFVDKYTLGKTLAAYSVGNAGGTQVWEITDPTSARNVLHNGGNFALPGDVLRRFVVFEQGNFKRVVGLGRVSNQNLHSLGYADNLVITHPRFLTQAKRLADYHRDREGISYHLVTVDQIYNEFSSGQQDPSGIRNFVRMFWQHKMDGTHGMARYLTLFGDASYDPKTYLNRSYKDSSGIKININSNYIPGWMTRESFSAGGGTYTTDDYFGMMLPAEGADNGAGLNGKQNIGIGRLLVRTQKEADDLVNKIIEYDSDPVCQADWRNRIMLMADDEDTPNPDVTFVPYNESLADIMRASFPVYNVDKLYLDAYDQVITAGQRYPDAEKALADKMGKGMLMLNYIGHGGEKGLTKERLMQTEDVDKWDTKDKLPFWITATCTFTRYDDPHFLSAGEYILIKPDGGGIALISTSRPIPPSLTESREYIKAVFTPDSSGEMPRLGDVVRRGKNNTGASGNAPLLLLFGDPVLRLAYPKNGVVTQTVTDENDMPLDTVRATQVVKVTGAVTDPDGFIMGDFNGWVYPTVFDKPSTLRTKQNDPGATLYVFELQKNILFKGKTKATNGTFEFMFKVPQDINYTFGSGKISYYATDGVRDAHGYDTTTVGGSLNNCLETDGPRIQLYLNDEWFVNGSTTGANPKIFAKLFDESGINLSGAGVGHDLLVTLSGPTNAEYVVNDFYQSEAGGYKSGELNYQLRDLPKGDYTLSLRAWDACTNSSTAELTFRVDSTTLLLNNLYNFPNPTNAGTTFSFEHNFAETNLQADLRIYTLQGQLVKTIRRTVNSPGYRNVQLQWDGNTDGGARLAAGMYVYTLYLGNGKGKTVKASNKLIITE